MTSESINSTAYQPFVKVERLSATLYQECVTQGYVKVNENEFILRPNHHSFVIDRSRNSYDLNTLHTSHSKPAAKLISPNKIVRYGVEDLKRDEVKRQEEIKKKLWLQKVLRKMLDKYHEKETKKEVLYRQKRLTKFVLNHREAVRPFTTLLVLARKYVKGRKHGRIILKELGSIKSAKIRKYVLRFFKDLLDAMEEVPKKKQKELPPDQRTESKINEEKVGNEIGVSRFGKSDYADLGKTALCNLVLDAIDPFATAPLSTGDQQLLECNCGKPNCLGMHPEKFYK